MRPVVVFVWSITCAMPVLATPCWDTAAQRYGVARTFAMVAGMIERSSTRTVTGPDRYTPCLA